MRMLLWNLLLALAWAAFQGAFTPANLLMGYLLGYGVLWLARPLLGPSDYHRKVRQAISFVLFFLWELVLANLRMAYGVLRPKHHLRPAVLAIPLEVTSDAEITLLANLITLTPGTLSLDVSTDRRVLYIHAMYVEELETVRRRIKRGFERRVLEVLR